MFLLNHPVARYLPEFSDPKVLERVGDEGAFRLIEPKRPMTVRHLHTHTSGLTYGEGNGDEVLASYYRVASIAGSFGGSESLSTAVGRIGRLPLLFHPGESWAYGFSTDVLGRLVEVVSEVDLAEFFQTRIFDPLGMHDTQLLSASRQGRASGARLHQDWERRPGVVSGRVPLRWPVRFPLGRCRSHCHRFRTTRASCR